MPGLPHNIRKLCQTSRPCRRGTYPVRQDGLHTRDQVRIQVCAIPAADHGGRAWAEMGEDGDGPADEIERTVKE
jgi:hypothetical protein